MRTANNVGQSSNKPTIIDCRNAQVKSSDKVVTKVVEKVKPTVQAKQSPGTSGEEKKKDVAAKKMADAEKKMADGDKKMADSQKKMAVDESNAADKEDEDETPEEKQLKKFILLFISITNLHIYYF